MHLFKIWRLFLLNKYQENCLTTFFVVSELFIAKKNEINFQTNILTLNTRFLY